MTSANTYHAKTSTAPSFLFRLRTFLPPGKHRDRSDFSHSFPAAAEREPRSYPPNFIQLAIVCVNQNKKAGKNNRSHPGREDTRGTGRAAVRLTLFAAGTRRYGICQRPSLACRDRQQKKRTQKRHQTPNKTNGRNGSARENRPFPPVKPPGWKA